VIINDALEDLGPENFGAVLERGVLAAGVGADLTALLGQVGARSSTTFWPGGCN
jgi:hypothetical protein